MKKLWLLPLLIFAPTAVRANTVTPAFTQGSMNATTTTTQTVVETVAQKVYGGELNSWSGTNVTPSGDITNSATTWSVTTAGEDFQLETVTRPPDSTTGLVLLETIDINRTINTNATTTSFSVFSQQVVLQPMLKGMKPIILLPQNRQPLEMLRIKLYNSRTMERQAGSRWVGIMEELLLVMVLP